MTTGAAQSTEPTGRRARRVAQTRQRIVEAAVELHTTVGPPRTTISGIAELAGVQRHTVYAHFPDDASLLAACNGLWDDRHPFPDVAAWAGIGDPHERLAVALRELYAFYSGGGADLVVAFAGAEQTPFMAPALARRAEQYATIAGVLARGRGARGRRRARLMAALEHAIHLDTWSSLCAKGGLTEAEAVAVLVGLVETADGPIAGGPP